MSELLGWYGYTYTDVKPDEPDTAPGTHPPTLTSYRPPPPRPPHPSAFSSGPLPRKEENEDCGGDSCDDIILTNRDNDDVDDERVSQTTDGSNQDSERAGQRLDSERAGQRLDSERTGQRLDSERAGQRLDSERAGQRLDSERAGQRLDSERAGQRLDSERAGQGLDSERAGQRLDSERTGQRADSERTGQRLDSERTGQRLDSERTGQRADSERTIQRADSERTGQGVDSERSGQRVDSQRTGLIADLKWTGQRLDSEQTGQIANSERTIQRVDSERTGQRADSERTGQRADSERTGHQKLDSTQAGPRAGSEWARQGAGELRERPGPRREVGSLAEKGAECGWCGRQVVESFVLSTVCGPAQTFCSERCFSHCRRASFKSSKVCDWCQHVRHAVSFVNLEDGDEGQAQFCSEKCLSQYKMNVICTETQRELAHIRKDQTSGQGASHTSSTLLPPRRAEGGAALSSPAARRTEEEEEVFITPNLWLHRRPRDSFSKSTARSEEREAELKKRNEGKDTIQELDFDSVSKIEAGNEELVDRQCMSKNEALVDKKWKSLSMSGGVAVLTSCANGLRERLDQNTLVPEEETRLSGNMELNGGQRSHPIRDSKLDLCQRQTRSANALTSSEIPQSFHSVFKHERPTPVSSLSPPQEGGRGARLAGSCKTSPLLCSFCPESLDRRHGKQSALALHVQGSSCPTKARSSGSSSSVTSLRIVSNGKSPSYKETTAKTANARLPLLPPPLFPVGVAALTDQHGGFPQGVPLPPFMLGLPPFAYAPGLLLPDPAHIGGCMGTPPSPLFYPMPPRPSTIPPPPLCPPQRERREERQRPGNEAGVSVTGVNGGGVPPVTVMVPFPVPLPIPVPIPIPFPMAPDKIQQFFRKHESSVNTRTASPRVPTLTSPSSSPSEHHVSNSISPARDKGLYTSESCHGAGGCQPPDLQHRYHCQGSRQEEKHADLPPADVSCCPPILPERHRTTTAACCLGDLRPDGVCSMSSVVMPARAHQALNPSRALRASRLSSDPAVLTLGSDGARGGVTRIPAAPSRIITARRPHSPAPPSPVTLDLSKRARLSENNHQEDEAMDLTKHSTGLSPVPSPSDLSFIKSSSSPSRASIIHTRSNDSITYSTKENQEGNHLRTSFQPSSESPPIHMVDSGGGAPPPPPVAQPLLVPPADKAYSTRRSLILDAPSVPKAPPTSPCLQQRRYVRTVPPEMVEAAKRRCMRARIARIRTK